MQFAQKMQPLKMGFLQYIEALEEERRKIQVFPKELPLSLELVTQAIEACRQQLAGTVAEYNLNGQSECSEQTSTDGPVFEEFIPLKKRASQDSVEEEDEDEEHFHKHKKTATDKKKSDWLRSVQLWNPNPPPTKEDVVVPRKTDVVEVKRNGGAFQPFQREEKSGDAKASINNDASAIGKAPSSPPVPATSSTGPVRVENKKEEKGQAQRKQRRCWSQELHKRFLHALQQLGGADSATPKQIRELMKVDGLTNDEVKSHLQKFRLHTRRSPIIHNNASSQAGPLFLVGNIFVQPPEYAAVATTSTASGEELTTVTTTTAPTGIYAPVAAHPPAVTHTLPIMKQKEHSHSEERPNHSVLSNSPASSSSTHTITTSPPVPN
ncbi:hypothetical protein AAZX31_01G079500 [Glycine max]|uniref:HTH myb-type domain-containing protein n=2 Tax=Glycine subgen. Soja TaxID=1462606 RepID=I1J6P8_SOYBN|nr:transcription factor HHO2 [Glycine max]XP_028234117.1 transcription factor HHO2-like [Glycine soja]KAG5068633.1 hypothetical protein JHK85_001010 [Glycine max]KAG5088362.1 hypothetical protein JHK86_000974 [Glycine max]KAH1162242.1 hypothetical protein GYH30_000931 [Glycine max]KAH1265408.1 Transcription factor HHO3 [Glycine max]KHN32268.1 Two-component response regulator ARR18 [Glycine soja]|eukprot:XP_003516846.1 transcription factor HHO2 [Glycine max]